MTSAERVFAPDDPTQPDAETALSRQEFGRRVQDHMVQLNLNQSDLARAADLTRDNISCYVRGRSYPGPGNLKKLADALHIEPQELLPNILMKKADSRDTPFEMRQIPGESNRIWVRLNQAMSMEQAAGIMNILKNLDNN